MERKRHPWASAQGPAPLRQAVGYHVGDGLLEVAMPEDHGGRLHHIRAGQLDSETAQTGGMRRAAAICGATTGSSAIWMGETRVAPASVFLDGDEEVRLETGPGDYVYVPPFVPHREENPSPDQDAVVVIARTTQEAV